MPTFAHVRTITYATASGNTGYKEEVSGDNEINRVVQGITPGSEGSIAINLVRSKMRGLCIVGTVPFTIKTNSSGSPADTVVVGDDANWKLLWSEKDPRGNPFSHADVTTLYFHNDSVDTNLEVSIAALTQEA